jgi:hypothetical protein
VWPHHWIIGQVIIAKMCEEMPVPREETSPIIVFLELAGGRYVGFLLQTEGPKYALHECPYDRGGGDAGNKAPLPHQPPPRALPVELEPPSY